jgi:hypothetical protein
MGCTLRVFDWGLANPGLTDASPGSARSPGLRVCRGAASRHRNIHTHAPFRTECQSFLRCRDVRLTTAEHGVGSWSDRHRRSLKQRCLANVARAILELLCGRRCIGSLECCPRFRGDVGVHTGIVYCPDQGSRGTQRFESNRGMRPVRSSRPGNGERSRSRALHSRNERGSEVRVF